MKSKWIAYILLLVLGPVGGHKFYLNKIGMGIAYVFTGGFLGIGLLVDLFTLGSQVDLYNATQTQQIGTGPAQNIIVNVSAPSIGQSEVHMSAEKQILALADQSPQLSVRQIVSRTNLGIDEAENTLKRLVASGIARERIDEEGRILYDFS